MHLTRHQTGAILVAIFVGCVCALLALEAVTLADSTPDNHITAVIRNAWEGDGNWVFLWLCSSLAYLAGHFFASRRQCPHCRKLRAVLNVRDEFSGPMSEVQRRLDRL